MIVIDCNAIRTPELAWLVDSRAELGHERAAIIAIITREYLRSIVLGINDEQETSMMIKRLATAQYIGRSHRITSCSRAGSVIKIRPSMACAMRWSTSFTALGEITRTLAQIYIGTRTYRLIHTSCSIFLSRGLSLSRYLYRVE